MKRAISREHIAKYWGTIDTVDVDAAGMGSNGANDDANAEEASTSGLLARTGSDKRQKSAGPHSVYELGSFEVLDELDTPVWLFNPRERRNLWANKATLGLYGMSTTEFLELNEENCTHSHHSAAGEAKEDGCGPVEASKRFFECAGQVCLNGNNDGRKRLQCHLPCLCPTSPHSNYLFTIHFRRVEARSEATGKAEPICLVTAESSRLFDSFNQSLRALEMLKSSPIFTFLFTNDGKLLTANPCAVTFYEKYFGPRDIKNTRSILSLQNILLIGDWAGGSVTYPDNNGPPPRQETDKRADPPGDDLMVDLMNHIQQVLFVQKFESFRIQMRMPKRRDPSKYRWVEFEMWAANDPVTKSAAILVNQTNLQETKKLELELKHKHENLQSKNEALQVELKKAQITLDAHIEEHIDLDSTVDKTVDLLDNLLAGKETDQASIRRLKEALRTRDLRAPNRLEEMLLSNKKGFEGEVGLSLFEMLNPNTQNTQPLSARSEREKGNLKKSLSRNSTMELDVPSPSGEAAEPAGPKEAILAAASVPKPMDLTQPILEVLETADGWFFDAFELEKLTLGHPLCTLGCHLFKRLNLYETFSINESQFFHFLVRIEAGYPANAYHNRAHVANVVQSMYVLLTKGLGPAVAGDQEIIAGLLAAIIHDFEHKGVNNDYLVRFQDELALTYNDKSPLENHHISAAFEVMLTKPYDIFANTNLDLFIKLRKYMIEMILATDMKIHFDVLGRFRLIERKFASASGGPGSGTATPLLGDPQASQGESTEGAMETSESTHSHPSISLPGEDVSLSLQMALKCADIGHVYCESNVHLRWVQKLEQEFFAQGDMEGEMGAIGKSPLMDREKAGITKSQVGFFKVVVVPLFKSFCTAFPGCDPALEYLNRNLRLWAKIEEEQLEISEVFVTP